MMVANAMVTAPRNMAWKGCEKSSRASFQKKTNLRRCTAGGPAHGPLCLGTRMVRLLPAAHPGRQGDGRRAWPGTRCLLWHAWSCKAVQTRRRQPWAGGYRSSKAHLPISMAKKMQKRTSDSHQKAHPACSLPGAS